jgi:hypothetical protein
LTGSPRTSGGGGTSGRTWPESKAAVRLSFELVALLMNVIEKGNPLASPAK